MSEALPQPLIVSTSDTLTPPGRRFWLDDSMFEKDEKGMFTPRFSVQEIAKTFFAQSSDWLRWRMRPDKPNKQGEVRFPEGFFVLDGKPLKFKRLISDSKDPNHQTARYFTLADIERMAHALAQQGIIDGLRLGNILTMLRCCARLYGIPDVEPVVVMAPIAENAEEQPEDGE